MHNWSILIAFFGFDTTSLLKLRLNCPRQILGVPGDMAPMVPEATRLVIDPGDSESRCKSACSQSELVPTSTPTPSQSRSACRICGLRKSTEIIHWNSRNALSSSYKVSSTLSTITRLGPWLRIWLKGSKLVKYSNQVPPLMPINAH